MFTFWFLSILPDIMAYQQFLEHFLKASAYITAVGVAGGIISTAGNFNFF